MLFRENGAIAQLVEQRTENPCVPGSIPGGTTKETETLDSVWNQGFLFLPGQNKRCFGAYFQVKPAQVRNMENAFCELQKAFPESFTEKPGRQNSSGPAAREEAFMTVAPPLTDAGIEARV